MVAALGAGGLMAAVLSAAGTAALAQPVSARGITLPTACVAIEALVSDGQSGPGLKGEILRVQPGGQSTLTTDAAPPGSPQLDDPSDMAFMSNGDIVVTNEAFTGTVPDVVEVNQVTGARTLISGNGRGSGRRCGSLARWRWRPAATSWSPTWTARR